MNRKEFLKKSFLGLATLMFFPKEIFSSPENPTDKPSNDKAPDYLISSDLIKFSKQFSENYKKLKCGKHVSSCGKYTIAYPHQIRDNYSHKLINTPYRVGHITGIMEFSKSKMCNVSPSVIFHAVIWCQILIKDQPESADYSNADIQALKCAVENGYSKKEISDFIFNMFSKSPSELNKDRADKLLVYLKSA